MAQLSRSRYIPRGFSGRLAGGVPQPKKPAQAFATPPSGPKLVPRFQPVTSKTPAYITPAAPPISTLPKPAPVQYTPTPVAVMAPTRTSLPATSVRSNTLQPMNPNALSAAKGGLKRPVETMRPLPVGVDAVPSSSGSWAPRAPMDTVLPGGMSVPAGPNTVPVTPKAGYFSPSGIFDAGSAPAPQTVTPQEMAKVADSTSSWGPDSGSSASGGEWAVTSAAPEGPAPETPIPPKAEKAPLWPWLLGGGLLAVGIAAAATRRRRRAA